MLKLILIALLVFGFFLAVWWLRKLWRAFCGGVSLLIAAMVGSLRRAAISGSVPWNHVNAMPAQVASAESAPSDFHRLAREAMFYASRPNVTVMHQVAAWPDDQALIRTTADPYGRRVYIECQRLIVGQVVHTVCLYLDRDEAPAEVGSVQYPAEEICVGVLSAKIDDIVRAGASMSFRDTNGRIRETRLPKEVKHHA